MSVTAFIFSGQGAQHSGMGLNFAKSDSVISGIFDRAEAARPGTLAQLSAEDPEILKQTENTQPCLYLADLAAALYMKKLGVSPACAAGFSLGEIPALAFAGAFSFDEGFRIVTERGRLMGREAKKHDAGMAAVVKLSNETVEEICARHKLYPVNYNSPGQLVVSGEKADLAAANEDFRAAGGRVMPLNVSGAFHSPFMSAAAADFNEFLKSAETVLPEIPVYANLTARPYDAAPALSLAAQIDHPVRWEETVRSMAEKGVDTFIETGVGTVLSKLVAKIVPGARVFPVETPEQAEAAAKEVLAC